ncbi:MAG TPA: S8 family serine peptidase, partial [Fibrobacteria bacterium]|nr:S8 family serine peptidase [Fibrobacteria bacterium]
MADTFPLVHRLLRGASVLPVLGAILFGAAWAHGGDAARAVPNLALSASFAPVRYVAQDSAQRARLEAFLRELEREAGGATAAFSIRGNTVTLSRRWVTRLAAGENPALSKPGASLDDAHHDARHDEHHDEQSRREQARQRLQREIGGLLEEAGMGFPAGYLPGEASFVYQATADEEDKEHCRQKPMWPYLETSLFCGKTVSGADIGMARVWERLGGADTLVIAVLDAGFDFLHHDLQERWAVNVAEADGLMGVDDDGNGFVDDIRGWDFVDDDNDPQDYNGHGTETAGVIAAGFDNGIGIPGMLPHVKILPVRVLSTAGFGSTESIAAGVRYAVARGAHVINFSIGISTPGTNLVLRNAFAAARDAG